jgi:high-affinity nickel permease
MTILISVLVALAILGTVLVLIMTFVSLLYCINELRDDRRRRRLEDEKLEAALTDDGLLDRISLRKP